MWPSQSSRLCGCVKMPRTQSASAITPCARQLGDREVGHGVAALQAEQAAERGDRRVGAPAASACALTSAEHELEHRVVELRRRRRRPRAGRCGVVAPGSCRPVSARPNSGSFGSAGAVGRSIVEADATEPRLARHGRAPRRA